MYRAALGQRAAHHLGGGSVTWLDLGEGVIAFDNGDVRVIANVSGAPVPFDGEVLATSGGVTDTVPVDTTVWLKRH